MGIVLLVCFLSFHVPQSAFINLTVVYGAVLFMRRVHLRASQMVRERVLRVSKGPSKGAMREGETKHARGVCVGR